jgi:hypothetical protein
MRARTHSVRQSLGVCVIRRVCVLTLFLVVAHCRTTTTVGRTSNQVGTIQATSLAAASAGTSPPLKMSTQPRPGASCGLEATKSQLSDRGARTHDAWPPADCSAKATVLSPVVSSSVRGVLIRMSKPAQRRSYIQSGPPPLSHGNWAQAGIEPGGFRSALCRMGLAKKKLAFCRGRG